MIVQNLPVPFDRRVWLESTSLQRNGYEVTVICPKMKGHNRGHEVIEDVDIYRYPIPFEAQSAIGFFVEFAWAWLATALLSVRVAVFGRGFDAIHACNPPDTYWALARLWGLAGKKFLYDHHDLSPEMYEAKYPGKNGVLHKGLLFLEKQTFQTAHVALATNESHKEVAIDRGGMDSDDVFIVRSGPDLKRFTNPPPDPSWKKGKQHMLVYLGDISFQDGVDGLVRIVEILSRTRDDFHAVVVGGGSAWNDVKNLADQLGVAHLMTFTGVVSDETLCAALSSATVAVDTVPPGPWSDRSTMNKIVEYMYFGLPIVAYDLLETRRSAEDAVAVAMPGTEEGFAQTVGDLFDDPERRSNMSASGKDRLRTQLSWNHSVPHLLDAYERLLGAEA